MLPWSILLALAAVVIAALFFARKLLENSWRDLAPTIRLLGGAGILGAAVLAIGLMSDLSEYRPLSSADDIAAVSVVGIASSMPAPCLLCRVTMKAGSKHPRALGFIG